MHNRAQLDFVIKSDIIARKEDFLIRIFAHCD